MLSHPTLSPPLTLPRRPAVRAPFASPALVLVTLSFAIPTLLFGIWTYRFGVNVPQWDDFSVLATLRYWKENGDLATQLRCLLAPHNEHRIVYTRLVAWGISRFSGGPVDFRLMMLIGNAAVPGLVGLLLWSFRRSHLPLLPWLPVPFLLMQMQYFENCFFAMAAVQNLTVWLWAGLALRLLCRPNGRSLVLAGGFALLATGTSGNGLLVWWVGAGLLMDQRRYRALAGWAVATVLVTTAYTSGLAAAPRAVSLFSVVQSYFGYLGAAVGAGTGMLLPVATGIVLTTAVVVVGWRLRRRESAEFWTGETGFWLAFAGFVILSAVAIAFRREPIDVVSVSRYRIGSALMLALTYLLTVRALGPERVTRWGLAAVIAGSVLFWGATYHRALPHVITLRTELLQDVADFEHAGRLTKAAYQTKRPLFEREWAEAVRWDLYRF